MDAKENTMEMVVRDGIRFIESLTRHYGPERGQEIWKGIGDVVGKEVRGKIFFAMITGETLSDRVTFTCGDADRRGHDVPVIKAIRIASGLGLKEAKDQWDHSKTMRGVVQCSSYEDARALVKNLRDLGCSV
jgi:ribosomal protein L7/L12